MLQDNKQTNGRRPYRRFDPESKTKFITLIATLTRSDMRFKKKSDFQFFIMYSRDSYFIYIYKRH